MQKVFMLSTVAFLAGCSGWTLTERGDEGQPCFTNGQCNAGLTCIAEVCQAGAPECTGEQTSCDGVWARTCQGGVWVRITDCSVGDKICQDGACLRPSTDGDEGDGDVSDDGTQDGDLNEAVVDGDSDDGVEEELVCDCGPAVTDCCDGCRYVPENAPCLTSIASCTTQTCNVAHQCDLTGSEPDTCYIEGVCYQEFDISPNNQCWLCNSSYQWDDWSIAYDFPCDDGDPCTVYDKCTDNGHIVECIGTPQTCNDHGVIGIDCMCECDKAYEGDYCDRCVVGALGEYPHCFKASASFCQSNQCGQTPPTGQTTCYDNSGSGSCPGGSNPPACGDMSYQDFCGQDAQYPDNDQQMECMSFLPAGCDSPLYPPWSVKDSLTGLEWTFEYASDKTWDEAYTYCIDQRSGGYTDWRLPTTHELFSLVDSQTSNPAAKYPFGGQRTGAKKYWTSTEPSGFGGNSKVVNFAGGTANNDAHDSNNKFAVRCVRGGVTATDGSGGNRRWAPEVDPLLMGVKDLVTELIWAPNRTTTNVTWLQALAYCEKLGTSTGSGYKWRLPSKNELLSIVDFSQSGLATTMPAFPSIAYNDSHFWTSTTDVGGPAAAWTVWMVPGDVLSIDKTAPKQAICVRNP